MSSQRIAGFVLAALALAPAALSAQRAPADSARWLVAQGDSAGRYAAGESVDAAFRFWKEAAEIHLSLDDFQEAAAVLDRIGTRYRNNNQPDSAFVYFRRTLDLGRSLPDARIEAQALYEFGNVWGRTLAQRDSGLAYYHRALPIAQAAGDSVTVAQTLVGLGYVHGRAGRADSALIYYRQAVDVRLDLGDVNGALDTTGQISMIYRDVLGQPDSALAHWNAALGQFRARGARAAEVPILLSIADHYQSVGRMDASLAYAERARDIATALGDSVLVSRAAAALEDRQYTLGLARPPGMTEPEMPGERRPENSDSILASLKEAVATAVYMVRPLMLLQISQIHFDAAEPDSGFAYLRRSLHYATVQSDLEMQQFVRFVAAMNHDQAGDPDSAVVYLQQGLRLARSRGDLQWEKDLLGMTAGVIRRSVKPRDPRRAFAYFDSAAAVTSKLAAHTGSDRAMLSYAEMQKSVFERWALTALELAPELGPAAVARSALAIAERGRAQAMRDQLLRAATGRRGLSLQPFTTPGSDLVSEADQLTAASARAGAPALYYFVTEDTLFTWLLRGEGEVEMSIQAVARDTLAALIAGLRHALGADGAASQSRMLGSTRQAGAGVEPAESEGIRAVANAAKRLSDLLFPTALAEHLPTSGELILLPHGALNLIPFAVLPSASGEPLGRRYALRYAPSLAMLAEVELRPSSIPPGARNAGLGRNLVIGNPAMPEVHSASGASVQLTGLPGAELEGAWIGERLGTTTLTGAAASEPEVRLRLPEATIVHLATHAFVYSSAEQVASSFIALAPAPGADGLLTMNEILRETPALAAEIVALSACQTGLGEVSESEGTVGLQRAFLAKGARSVLASLWSVSDEATALLMRRFYTHWLEDASISKAEALRRAQEEVSMTAGFESPLYWAAFQLVGAT